MNGNWKRALSRSRIVAALALAVVCTTAGLARGEEFTVSDLNDAGAGSLRQAILDANSREGADVIRFESFLEGTIGLTSGQLGITDTVTIEGPGADWLAVSRTVADPLFRVFCVAPGVTVCISGLSITGGHADYGGGIYDSGTLTLDGCLVSDNFAGYYALGGGIWNDGTLVVTGCTVSNNQAGDPTLASGFGGGISNYG